MRTVIDLLKSERQNQIEDKVEKLLNSWMKHQADMPGWEVLPLFPDLPPCPPAFIHERTDGFEDPFLDELMLSAPVQRLKHIGFLGAIDYMKAPNGTDPHRRRHNRFDHSVGVAELARLYADIRGLSRRETRVLTAAGLLHDIGHGPLSHTLEPVFREKFGLTHHQSGDDILRGRSPFGDDILDIMSAYKVDLDEVVAMIEGKHDGPHAYLYSGPINLDTIEGISRSRALSMKSGRPLPPKRLVAEMALGGDDLPTGLMDEFWKLKDEVYNLVIHHPWGLVFDGLAQAYMAYSIDDFGPDDFLKTEDQLRNKTPELFYIFAWAQRSHKRAYHRVSEMVPEVLDYELKAPRRSFTVNRDVTVTRPTDLSRRYTQSKVHRMVTIADLVASNATREAAF
ncbi:HD domain-containing protein [Parvularcula sp. ZS-1/3]|uniref:HD domain-containing protein n=1 Tax=Parvularcula mediterranea TaxID=2732508 RepID=A0A7Y3RN10_9PROT|nr:HD domain-containing protein [Parvularcula mediterranea]NNU17084.1 HD domain-containing protein [Parvularcula mediterranea]